jgi:hypothetical protein
MIPLRIPNSAREPDTQTDLKEHALFNLNIMKGVLIEEDGTWGVIQTHVLRLIDTTMGHHA